MKKKFQLEISKPCAANLNAMQKTNDGFFCSSCVKNVIDLSHKTNAEVVRFIAENKKNTSICAQLNVAQLDQEFEYNSTDASKSLKYAIAVAASVLLSTNVTAQEKSTPNTAQHQSSQRPKIKGEMAVVVPKTTTVSFTVKGRLLNSTTNKPFLIKEYGEMHIMVNGAQNRVAIDTETGAFSIAVTVEQNVNELAFYIDTSTGSYAQKTIRFDSKSIQRKTLQVNLKIDPKKELKMQKVAGGLGVIYKGSNRNGS